MDGQKEMKQAVDFRNYLAAERTLLAWIRTGLALMGFGFVVARFGLFLQQLQIARYAPSAQPDGLSLWFGTALIGAGVAVNLFSGWQHLRLFRIMKSGTSDASPCYDFGRSHIWVPSPRRAGNGDLSEFSPWFRAFKFWNQFPKQ